MEFFSLKWLAILGAAAAWTIFFSCFNAPGIRGWRNLGWLACYVAGVVMFFFLPWRAALGTWALIGIASGLVYFGHELLGYLRSREADARPNPRTIANGLLFWPIKLPEAVEYLLADLGVLKAPAAPPEQS